MRTWHHLAVCALPLAIVLGGCVPGNPPVDMALSVQSDGGEVAPVAAPVAGSAVLGCEGRPDGTIQLAARSDGAARGAVIRLNDGSPSLALVWLQQAGKGARIGAEDADANRIPLVGVVKREGDDWLVDVETDFRPGVDLPITGIAGQALLPVPGQMRVAVKGRMPALSARGQDTQPALRC